VIWFYRIASLLCFIIAFNASWFWRDIWKKSVTDNELGLYSMIVMLACVVFGALARIEKLETKGEE